MTQKVMVTTVDNPFDYFTEFKDWKNFDEEKGYFTCEYLARVCNSSPNLSPELNELAVEEAIDEICDLNVLGIYKKVYKNKNKEEDLSDTKS